MTTFLGAPKPSMSSTANPILTNEGIDFTEKCHYTLDVYICTHKQYRKPRVTHVQPCPYLSGTHRKTQCFNFSRAPMVVQVAELCPKCTPEEEKARKEESGSGSVEASMELKKTDNSEQVDREGEDSDIDDDDEEAEMDPNGKKSWTRVEGDIPSLENGTTEVKTSILQRVYQAFAPVLSPSGKIEGDTKRAEKDMKTDWIKVDVDPDWDNVHPKDIN